MKRVAVVVLNWNGWRHSLACLESLRQLEYPDYDILVVDNASTDGSVEHIQRAMPELRVFQSGTNFCFDGGCNVGMAHAAQAGAEYIWLINIDATCVPQAPAELVRMADTDARLGALGAVIYVAGHKAEIQLSRAAKCNFGMARRVICAGLAILERVDDDARALSKKRRVLRPGGKAVLQKPSSPMLPTSYKDKGVQSSAARTFAYGRDDHVRLYGRDILHRFCTTGFVSPVVSQQDVMSDVAPSMYGVNPRVPSFLFERI